MRPPAVFRSFGCLSGLLRVRGLRRAGLLAVLFLCSTGPARPCDVVGAFSPQDLEFVTVEAEETWSVPRLVFAAAEEGEPSGGLFACDDCLGETGSMVFVFERSSFPAELDPSEPGASLRLVDQRDPSFLAALITGRAEVTPAFVSVRWFASNCRLLPLHLSFASETEGASEQSGGTVRVSPPLRLEASDVIGCDPA